MEEGGGGGAVGIKLGDGDLEMRGYIYPLPTMLTMPSGGTGGQLLLRTCLL